MRAEERILVVGPSWVGDMVMAQSLFAELKQQSPDVDIDVLGAPWSAGIVGRMPQVNSLVESPFPHGRLALAARYRLGRSLAGYGYTRAIILPNSWKSAMVPVWAHIPVRTGYLGEQRWGLINDVRRLDKKKLPMMVQRFVALGRSNDGRVPDPGTIPLPRLKVDEDAARSTAAQFGLEMSGSPILILCPGSEFGSAKRWPVGRYQETARYYLDRDFQVAIVGSQGDRAIAEQIAGLPGEGIVNLAGRTTLVEVVEILSGARIVISNDSGLMHIAAAVRAPLIAVYGSTDPGFTPPLGDTSTVIRLGLDCSPCFKRECPLGHLDCLNNITAGQVVSAADKILVEFG